MVEFVRILEHKNLGGGKEIAQELMSHTKDQLVGKKLLKAEQGNSSPVSKFFLTSQTPDNLEFEQGSQFNQKMHSIQQFG